MERLAAEMEAEEKAEFKPIYEQFTEDEKERYQDMQDADDSTRIGMIMTYEESGRDIKQVRIMLD